MSNIFQKLAEAERKEREELFAPAPSEPNQAARLFAEIKQDWDDNRTYTLMAECRQQVITNVVTPFGLGKFLSAHQQFGDKMGGNVPTLHTVRDLKMDVSQSSTFFQDERAKFDDHKENNPYNSTDYHADAKYRKKNKQSSEKKKAGNLTDAYTGEVVDKNAHIDQDHVVSASEIHNDPAVILAEVNGVELANKDSNLQPTVRSVNRSKGQDKAEKFAERLEANKDIRNERIRKLEEKERAEGLTDKEQKEKNKLEKLNKVDTDKLKKLGEKARKEYERTLQKEYYLSKKFGMFVLKSGGAEAMKMGLQQAVGLALVDFLEGVFFEAHDSFTNGFVAGVGEEEFLKALRIRLERVARKVAENWRNVLTAFKDGALSGFLSNIFTTFINTFFTTAAKLVRMIREGTFALFRAFKQVIFPPSGMTMPQALDAGLKAAVAGVFVVGGISLDAMLEQAIISVPVPILGDIKSQLITVLSGGLVGVATAMSVYFLDKIDLFGVNCDALHAHTLQALQKEREQSDAKIANYMNDLALLNGEA